MTQPTARQPLSMLVYGPSKAGKSMVGASTQAPRLLLDCENAAQFLPINPYPGRLDSEGRPTEVWNPRDPFPPYDGTWDTLVVKVDKWETALTALEKLEREPHYIRSVVLDSVSELQFMYATHRYGTNALRTQDWGEVYREMRVFCTRLRDMPARPNTAIDGIVVTATMRETEEGNDTVRKPFLQGAMKDQIAYLFDIFAYLEKNEVLDEATGSFITVRTLYTREQKPKRFIAGQRVLGRVPDAFRLPSADAETVEEFQRKNFSFRAIQTAVWKGRRKRSGPEPEKPIKAETPSAAPVAEKKEVVA